MSDEPIEDAIERTKVAIRIFKILQNLPDDETRARIMGMAAAKFGHYDEAIAFLNAAKRESSK